LMISFIIILPSMLRFPKPSLSIRFPCRFPLCISHLLHASHMPRPSHSSGFDRTKNYKVCRSRSFCLCSLFSSSLTTSILGPNTWLYNLINKMHLQMWSSYGPYSLTGFGFFPFFLPGI
jgi:hypothetical protein